jgi:transcription antitermination factor NusG
MASEVFLPRIVERVRAGLRIQRRVAAMFPSYVFARLPLDEQGKAVRYAHGVRDFVRCAGEPQAVPLEVVELLQARTWPSGVYEPPPIRFHAGERLQINEGPLRGVEVIFEREMSGPHRVAVLLADVCFSARVILHSEALWPA